MTVCGNGCMEYGILYSRTCIKLDTLTREQTHDLTLPLHGQYHGENYGNPRPPPPPPP